MKNLDELLTIAHEAADIGSRMMTTQAPGTVSAKGDRDYVTELDVRIQHAIRDHLHQAAPSIDFLGEEDGGGALDETTEYVWVLDPIDGTSNFAHGIPLCATSLALVHRGEPVIGVVTAPFLGLRYHATKDSSAYCNNQPIHASNTTDLRRAIVSIGDYATGPGAIEKNQQRFAITKALAANVERIRMLGAASLDLAWVAEGRTDACVILSNKPWDMAAGALICRSAGAFVVDSLANPYSFTATETIAATKSLKSILLASIFTS
ncbi:inositol monophosphatase family protein [Saccharomonospora sp.]|uniref:inositol monophosphatase family protein n=1 Tax=Saccharomonospora sp. TaxID=33913 RepID=UPI00262E8C9B|nr:inositol monophosphatase family protein [Saccharomonospora sp.]